MTGRAYILWRSLGTLQSTTTCNVVLYVYPLRYATNTPEPVYVLSSRIRRCKIQHELGQLTMHTQDPRRPRTHRLKRHCTRL